MSRRRCQVESAPVDEFGVMTLENENVSNASERSEGCNSQLTWGRQRTVSLALPRVESRLSDSIHAFGSTAGPSPSPANFRDSPRRQGRSRVRCSGTPSVEDADAESAAAAIETDNVSKRHRSARHVQTLGVVTTPRSEAGASTPSSSGFTPHSETFRHKPGFQGRGQVGAGAAAPGDASGAGAGRQLTWEAAGTEGPAALIAPASQPALSTRAIPSAAGHRLPSQRTVRQSQSHDVAQSVAVGGGTNAGDDDDHDDAAAAAADDDDDDDDDDSSTCFAGSVGREASPPSSAQQVGRAPRSSAPFSGRLAASRLSLGASVAGGRPPSVDTGASSPATVSVIGDLVVAPPASTRSASSHAATRHSHSGGPSTTTAADHRRHVGAPPRAASSMRGNSTHRWGEQESVGSAVEVDDYTCAGESGDGNDDDDEDDDEELGLTQQVNAPHVSSQPLARAVAARSASVPVARESGPSPAPAKLGGGQEMPLFKQALCGRGYPAPAAAARRPPLPEAGAGGPVRACMVASATDPLPRPADVDADADSDCAPARPRAMHRSVSAPPDESGVLQPLLPCRGDTKVNGMPSIDISVLRDVVEGHYNGMFSEIHIVDCRFPYEFDGGHIKGAINTPYLKQVKDLLFSDDRISQRRERPPKRVAVLFHCEFSSKRGPRAMQSVRRWDRDNNVYPRIDYPDIYLIREGYKAVFNKDKSLCEPSAYVTMDDERFADEFAIWSTNTKEQKSRGPSRSRSRTLSRCGDASAADANSRGSGGRKSRSRIGGLTSGRGSAVSFGSGGDVACGYNPTLSAAARRVRRTATTAAPAPQRVPAIRPQALQSPPGPRPRATQGSVPGFGGLPPFQEADEAGEDMAKMDIARMLVSATTSVGAGEAAKSASPALPSVPSGRSVRRPIFPGPMSTGASPAQATASRRLSLASVPSGEAADRVVSAFASGSRDDTPAPARQPPAHTSAAAGTADEESSNDDSPMRTKKLF